MDFLANTTADWFANNKTAFARSWLRNATPAGTVATRCHQSGTPRVFFFAFIRGLRLRSTKCDAVRVDHRYIFAFLNFFPGFTSWFLVWSCPLSWPRQWASSTALRWYRCKKNTLKLHSFWLILDSLRTFQWEHLNETLEITATSLIFFSIVLLFEHLIPFSVKFLKNIENVRKFEKEMYLLTS